MRNEREPAAGEGLRSTPRFADQAATALTPLGGGVPYIVISFCFILAGAVRKGLFLLAGLTATILVTCLIRTVYFKERPEPMRYETYIQRLKASSFPSQHATNAFFLAIALGKYSGSSAAIIVLLLLAAGVAWSRVQLRRHDSIDVAGGALLGVASFYVLTRLFPL